VLGGRDEDAFFHQAGGVADFGDVAADGLDLKAIEVDAAEDDARTRGGGEDAQMDGCSAVQADSTAVGGLANCTFVYQCGDEQPQRNIQITGGRTGVPVVFLPQRTRKWGVPGVRYYYVKLDNILKKQAIRRAVGCRVHFSLLILVPAVLVSIFGD
jgi:hypothetical protein